MIEIDDELAYSIHGILTSDSDSESDGKTEFDEEYNLLKPPPYDYNLIKSKVVIVSSQYTPEEWQEQLKTIENDNYIKISKGRIKSNAIQQLTAVQSVPKKRKSKKTKTGYKEINLNAPFSCGQENDVNVNKTNSNKCTKKKKKRKEHIPKTHAKKNQKKYSGIDIMTREQFLKEFPSLDEMYTKSRHAKIKRKQSTPSNVGISARKKKQFTPLEINMNITNCKTQYSLPQDISKVRNTKRTKTKRTVKQSMQVSVSKNLLEKVSDVDHIILMGQGKIFTKICIPVYIYGYDY